MYIKSPKNKSYFMYKTRFFFLLIFDCFIILSFSGCPGFDLLSSSVGRSKESEGLYSNTTTSNTMDENAKKVPVDMEIEIEEYEEVDSLKKSEIVFVGKSDLEKKNVSFRKDFIDLLREKYIGEFLCDGNLNYLLNYITLYCHSRTHDESFLEKKKIKVSPLTKAEQVIDNLAYIRCDEHMRLHLFSKKEDVIDSLFKLYTGRGMEPIVDFGTCNIFFKEFQYMVQLQIYHKYKKCLKVYTITDNDALLLVYDVNDKSSFDDLDMIIDHFSKNNSKHIFFILGDQSSSAGDVLGDQSSGLGNVGIIDDKLNSAGTDSNKIFDDNYVSEWCKKKEVEINTAGEKTNAEEKEINSERLLSDKKLNIISNDDNNKHMFPQNIELRKSQRFKK